MFLLVVISPENFANTNTTSTNRFIYISNRMVAILNAKHSCFSAWILVLFWKWCCTVGRTNCFLRQNGNSLGFEDLTSRTFEVIWMMSSKKAIQQPSGRFEACRLIRRYNINHINSPFCTIIKRKNMRFLLLICHNTDT